MSDNDNDSCDGMDTENEAGVVDWADFGSFDVVLLLYLLLRLLK